MLIDEPDPHELVEGRCVEGLGEATDHVVGGEHAPIGALPPRGVAG